MFETCKTVAELNKARIDAIYSGESALLVNKEYGKRKLELLTGSSGGYKAVEYHKLDIPEQGPEQVAIKTAYWVDNDPYTLYVV